ncbi:hypothetical protein M0804_000838 [Polistes exclamans]|nr:hypothetical protein M0804_000838 [Polistes exclamans]
MNLSEARQETGPAPSKGFHGEAVRYKRVGVFYGIQIRHPRASSREHLNKPGSVALPHQRYSNSENAGIAGWEATEGMRRGRGIEEDNTNWFEIR